MAIIVRGKNIEITPALKDYVIKKIGKVTKYFETLGEISVILKVEKGSHIVEVTVPINGMLLRGEESTADMYTSIDLVIEKLEKQIEKYKTKIARKLRGGSLKGEPVVKPQVPVSSSVSKEDEDFEMLVKTKRFAVKPVDIEEAIMQMNLINHDFYVFTNAETEEVNVVYRRKDGQYGLLEPEY